MLLLISERIHGLFIYKLNEENISAEYASALTFPVEIFEIEKSVASTHNFILIKSFEGYRIYYVSLEEMYAPMVVR